MSQTTKSLYHNLHQGLNHFVLSLNVEYISIFILWLFTISSLIGIGLGHLDWFITKTPLNLMLGFLLILINIPFGKSLGKPIFIFTFLFGMLLEIVGVFRGDIFGEYFYGENLGFKVLGVPIMIGIYWAVLTTITYQISRVFFDKIVYVALMGASLMVGLDFLMEQMAHTFDFWHFAGDIAPFQNYLVWFIASFILQLLAYKFYPKGGSRFASHLYLNQVSFFLIAYMLLRL